MTDRTVNHPCGTVQQAVTVAPLGAELLASTFPRGWTAGPALLQPRAGPASTRLALLQPLPPAAHAQARVSAASASRTGATTSAGGDEGEEQAQQEKAGHPQKVTGQAGAALLLEEVGQHRGSQQTQGV